MCLVFCQTRTIMSRVGFSSDPLQKLQSILTHSIQRHLALTLFCERKRNEDVNKNSCWETTNSIMAKLIWRAPRYDMFPS